MTGVAEGFGFALAVVPVIISVAEHVSEVSSVWFRYQNYGAEVRRHALALKTQRVVFKNDLIALLASCVGKTRAVDMFKALDDVAWKEPSTEDSLNELLGDERRLFMELIQLIHEQLRAAEQRALKFPHDVSSAARSDQDGHEVGSQESTPATLARSTVNVQDPRAVAKSDSKAPNTLRKAKFALLKKPQQEDVQQLRSLINDFHVLTEQLIRPSEVRPPERPSASSQLDVEKFRRVQLVSQALYDALGTACTVHSSHQVLLGLQPTIKDTLQHFQFSMALWHDFTEAHTELDAPIWLNVESELERPSTEHAVLNIQALCGPQRNGKRRTRSPSPPPSRQPTPHIRPSQINRQVEAVQYQAAQGLLEPPLWNICRSKNFCTRLLRCIRSSTYHSGYCLGFLEHPQRIKHLIYLNNHLHLSSIKHPSIASTSLADLLESFHRRGTRAASLPQFERLRFARMLATALLQFHATPWLNRTWCSKDVLFQGVNPSSPDELTQFAEPFISVLITDAQAATLSRIPHAATPQAQEIRYSIPTAIPSFDIPESTSSETSATRFQNTPVRNPMLYGLGVMLLELAFEAPIRALPVPFALRRQHTTTPHFPELAEYQKVKSLSLGTPSTLGPQFSKIIRKCLDCDFARGVDLNDPALQEGVYREVVCELKSLEDSFRELQVAT